MGLVGGAEHHPGGQEPTTRGELAGPVAAEVETGGDAAGADLIGRAQARHAGGGHHILGGEALQHGVDQKGLVLRGVEGLADDPAVRQEGVQVVLSHPGGVDGHGDVGGGGGQDVPQGLCFGTPQLGGEILLSVEVGQVHPVKVDEMEPAHSGPGQTEGQVGAQSAQSADGHGGGGEALLKLWPMSGLPSQTDRFPGGK